MTRNKNPSLKKKLAKASQHTRWAPFWALQKIFGLKRMRGGRIQPSRITNRKRSWRRTKIKI